MIARRQRLKNRGNGSHTRTEGRSRGASFQCRQIGFERRAVWILGARVDKASRIAPVRVALESRGKMNRRHDRARRWVWFLSGVDGNGFELHGEGSFFAEIGRLAIDAVFCRRPFSRSSIS